jgi:hypothetical protein
VPCHQCDLLLAERGYLQFNGPGVHVLLQIVDSSERAGEHSVD